MDDPEAYQALREMKRVIWIAVVLFVGAGFAAQYFDAEFARPRIERALERGLGRRVEVGKVYFNLFTGPGFTVDDVTIYDDPRAGIEPFAYVAATGGARQPARRCYGGS